MFLKGTIFVTDNVDLVLKSSINNTKIISLDEDGVLPQSPNIVGGLCLLPPIDAKIAEADVNEQLYDTIYSSHLLEPFQQQFIAALVSYLYKGGNLLLFLPELGYTNTTEKLIEHLFRIYGIHPGLIGNNNPQIANCYYDEKCIPMWLNLIYSARVISAYEYLYEYPADACINNNEILNQLVMELQPYGESYSDRVQYVRRFHQLIHRNPKVVPAISCLEV